MEIGKFEILEDLIKTVYKQESAVDACRLNDKSIAHWYRSKKIDVNAYRA